MKDFLNTVTSLNKNSRMNTLLPIEKANIVNFETTQRSTDSMYSPSLIREIKSYNQGKGQQ